MVRLRLMFLRLSVFLVLLWAPFTYAQCRYLIAGLEDPNAGGFRLFSYEKHQLDIVEEYSRHNLAVLGGEWKFVRPFLLRHMNSIRLFLFVKKTQDAPDGALLELEPGRKHPVTIWSDVTAVSTWRENGLLMIQQSRAASRIVLWDTEKTTVQGFPYDWSAGDSFEDPNEPLVGISRAGVSTVLVVTKKHVYDHGFTPARLRKYQIAHRPIEYDGVYARLEKVVEVLGCNERFCWLDCQVEPATSGSMRQRVLVLLDIQDFKLVWVMPHPIPGADLRGVEIASKDSSMVVATPTGWMTLKAGILTPERTDPTIFGTLGVGSVRGIPGVHQWPGARPRLRARFPVIYERLEGRSPFRNRLTGTGDSPE